MTVQALNDLLADARYIPTSYDARKLEDIVTFEVCGDVEFSIAFPVTIERTRMPVLSQRLSSLAIDRVTVITKTFLRYPCVKRLIESVGRFYPGMTVIVADDNPADKFEELTSLDTVVKQYRMPPSEGWFAGRALGASQVRTQFYLWV